MADSPKIIPQGTARSKANDTAQRLDSLMPDIATVYSPVKVYTPGADLQVQGSGDDLGPADYGWTCPDGIAEVQVECYGGAGGGGGGSATASGGGGGGGGGEYACEPHYPVIPGRTYSYFAPRGTRGGQSSVILADGSVSWPGEDGLATAFDFQGLGREGGVVANGGGGGDSQGIGTGGRGGTGSVNTVHFDGGGGGTSASGLMSDNPVFGLAGGLEKTQLWYRLDEDPAAGGLLARDFSQYSRSSVNVIAGNRTSGPAPTTAGGAPPQTPYGPQANLGGAAVPGETQGASWGFLHGSGGGYTGGIVAQTFTLAPAALTVSAWVKGAPDAAGAWDWGGTSANGRKTIIGNTEQTLGTGRRGWSLEFVITNATSATVQFFVSNSAGATATVSMAAPSATDGNWHQVTATYAPGAGNFILYLDGVVRTTGTATGIAAIGAGTTPITLAINASTLSYNMKGYLSNAWVATTVAPLSYVQFAYGQAVATGGSGGGASGGSAGAGNPGANAVAGTGGLKGAAAGAASSLLHGSGAGGDGGNSSADGIDGEYTAPFAGGGGGAGASATVAAMTVDEVPCVMSGSYTGLDSQGESIGQLYTVSADPSPAEVSPWAGTAAVNDGLIHVGGTSDRPFQGTMNAILTFPSLGDVNSSVDGTKLTNPAWVIQKCWLRLTVESPNACNVVIGSWSSNTVTGTLASDADIFGGGYGGDSSRVFIPAGPAGRQVTVPLDPDIRDTLVALAENNGYSAPYVNRGAGLLVGTLTGSAAYQNEDFGSWDSDEALDWYALIHGADQGNPGLSAALLIGYTASGATFNSGGTGAPGYIVVSYVTPEGVPVSTTLAGAATDAGGNAIGAGFTADAAGYNVWQPGSSPKNLETAHNATLINGWASSGAQPVLQYRLIPGGFVHLSGVVSGAAKTSTVLAVLPAGYRPARTQRAPVTTLATHLADGAFLQVNNASGNLELSSVITTSNTDVIISLVFPTT